MESLTSVCRTTVFSFDIASTANTLNNYRLKSIACHASMIVVLLAILAMFVLLA